MRTRIAAIAVALGGMIALAQTPAAPTLTIVNARILDGRGGVIDRGTILVRDGRITSVSAAAPASQGGTVLDARGMTVMPGFIDAHRHLMQGSAAQ